MMRFAVAMSACFLSGSLLLTGCFPSSTPGDEQEDPHYLNGRARVSSLDYKGALQEFEKAIEANPRSASAHLELALLYEEQLQDYAAAIYHYERHLKFRPNSEYSERAKERIKSCKMDLVKGEVLGPVTMGMQRELEKLVSENGLLKQRVETLEAQLIQQQAAAANALRQATTMTQAAPRPTATSQQQQPVRTTTPTATQYQQPQVTQASVPVTQPEATSRTPRVHIVKAGDKLTTIATQYGVSLNRLQQANPGIQPHRLQVGQSIKIP